MWKVAYSIRRVERNGTVLNSTTTLTCTMHHEPETPNLHPQPVGSSSSGFRVSKPQTSNLNPKSQTLSSEPSIRRAEEGHAERCRGGGDASKLENPKSGTRNPNPEIRNPKPQTRNEAKPETRNRTQSPVRLLTRPATHSARISTRPGTHPIQFSQPSYWGRFQTHPLTQLQPLNPTRVDFKPNP